MRFYTGNVTYDTVLVVALGFAAIAGVLSIFIPSPYGRFASERYGLSLDPRLGWLLMELPSTLSFLYFYLRGPRAFELVPLVFLAQWLLHYANRGFYFPLSIRTPRGGRGTFSITVILVGWFVTTVHGYLNATYDSSLSDHYGPAWLTDPRFLFGMALYAVSLALNIQCDAILRNLRTREEVEAGVRVYRIPQGSLFRWVTSPSYLTELLAWTGFAIAGWSLAGVFILAISVANLVPRAAATQRWYRERFPDYPPERRALIPFLW